MLPAADCGRFAYEPATAFREEEPGRTEPATEKPPPCDRDPWWCPELNVFSWPGGRENPLPSCSVTMRIPGRRGGGGGAALASEAAWDSQQLDNGFIGLQSVPMPFGSLESTEVVAELAGFFSSFTMVDVEDDRENVLEPGTRLLKWVSLSFFVNFQLILRRRRLWRECVGGGVDQAWI